MLRRYWEKVGGILIEEFLAVSKAPDRGPRCIDGIIIRSGEKRIAKRTEVSLRGEHITVVQVKIGRLGMYLMGQALFSMDHSRRHRCSQSLSAGRMTQFYARCSSVIRVAEL